MCGIIGLLAFNQPTTEDKKSEKARQEAMIILSTELLQNTQPRGQEATGIAVLFRDNEYMGLKMGISATDFISRFGTTEVHYNTFIDKWRSRPAPAAMVIGHCRKPSTGGNASPEDNMNNHPIKICDTIGVHNGTLNNHNEILKQLNVTKPDGKVDSEAIFRLVNHYNKNGEEPFTNVMIQEICKRLSGQYACLTFNSNNPFQMAAFRDGRPMEFALIKPLGLLLIASEKDILKNSIFKYNQMAYLYNGLTKQKLVPLKKADVDFVGSDDDSLYVFDIRKVVDENTKIQDLYISEKVPRFPKIWTSETKVYGSSTVYTSGYNQNNVTNKAADTVPAVKVPDIKVIDNHKRIGMLWNKTAGKYESIIDQKKADSLDNVVIDVESGEVLDVLNGELVVQAESEYEVDVKKSSVKLLPPPLNNGDHCQAKHILKEVYKSPEDLITDPAKIEIIEVTNVAQITRRAVSEYPVNKTVVDMKVRPDILERANKVSEQSENFKNVMDLAETLEVEDFLTLSEMPTNALANRVKKYVFADAYYKGYMACLEDEKKNTTSFSAECSQAFFKKSIAKQRNAKNIIRNLKTITKLLLGVSKNVAPEKVEDVVDEFVMSKELKHIDKATLMKTFSAGEIRQSPLLDRTVTSIMKKLED